MGITIAEEIGLYIIIFLYGIVIGSFVNVLIYRLPKHENIAVEHSHCMSCGHKLGWYDLVPLLSYIFLKGKCRYCKAKISLQYPLIEAVNGVGYVVIFYFAGLNLFQIKLNIHPGFDIHLCPKYAVRLMIYKYVFHDST